MKNNKQQQQPTTTLSAESVTSTSVLAATAEQAKPPATVAELQDVLQAQVNTFNETLYHYRRTAVEGVEYPETLPAPHAAGERIKALVQALIARVEEWKESR